MQSFTLKTTSWEERAAPPPASLRDAVTRYSRTSSPSERSVDANVLERRLYAADPSVDSSPSFMENGVQVESAMLDGIVILSMENNSASLPFSARAYVVNVFCAYEVAEPEGSCPPEANIRRDWQRSNAMRKVVFRIIPM
jgi:hypothetical protein